MDRPIKATISFCPTCYKKIQAEVFIRDGSVFMQKSCSKHGDFEAMVERDAGYYAQCLAAGNSNIYNGYFIDVTQRCNLKCKFCYYDVDNSKDPEIGCLEQDAQLHSNLAPFIITGGEPSLRKDLPEVVKRLKQIGPVELLTNGTGIDEKMFDRLTPLLMNPNKVISLNLSMHKESNGKDIELLERVEKAGMVMESLLFVIDDVKQIDGILSFCHGRSVQSVRIKAATNLWAEGASENKIYVSDMLEHMQKFNPQPVWWRNNKTSFFNVQIGGVLFMLVSWYDAENVDILDIACPPFYKAKTGHVENIVTAALINEGIKKGYMDGKRISNG